MPKIICDFCNTDSDEIESCDHCGSFMCDDCERLLHKCDCSYSSESSDD